MDAEFRRIVKIGLVIGLVAVAGRAALAVWDYFWSVYGDPMTPHIEEVP